MKRFVEGSYSTQETAKLALEGLLARGYDKQDMTFIANASAAQTMADVPGVRVLIVDPEAQEGDESLWDRIKDIFSTREEPIDLVRDDELLTDYQDKLAQGNIVLLVESGIESDDSVKDDVDKNNIKDQVDEDPQLNPDPTLDSEGRTIIVPPVSPTDAAINNAPSAGETGVIPPLVDLGDKSDEDVRR